MAQILGWIMVTSSVDKLAHPGVFRGTLRLLLPASDRCLRTMVIFVAVIELGVGGALLLDPAPRWPGMAALAFFTAIGAINIRIMLTRRDVPCGCGGVLGTGRLDGKHLAIVAALASLSAGIALGTAPTPRPHTWSPNIHAAALVAGFCGVILIRVSRFFIDNRGSMAAVARDRAWAGAQDSRRRV